MQKLFFIFFVINLLGYNNFYAADTPMIYTATVVSAISLEQGLLTEIQPTFVQIVQNQVGWCTTHTPSHPKMQINMGEKFFVQTSSPLIYSLSLARPKANLNNNQNKFPSGIFCPTIIKLNDYDQFENRKSYNPSLHKDAKEACRLKQACFYQYQQGAIIYSLRRLGSNILHIIEREKENIQKCIDSNYQDGCKNQDW
jgi:hypothetical protein